MTRFWSRDVANECGLNYTVSSTGICEPDHTYHAFPSPFKAPPVALSLSSSGRFLALVDRSGLFAYSIAPTRLFQTHSEGSYIDAFFVFEETILVALSADEVTFFHVLPPRQLRTCTVHLDAGVSATSFRNGEFERQIEITFSDDSVHFFAFPELSELDDASDDVRPLGYIRPKAPPAERGRARCPRRRRPSTGRSRCAASIRSRKSTSSMRRSSVIGRRRSPRDTTSSSAASGGSSRTGATSRSADARCRRATSASTRGYSA
jgi:hypothetical protein